MLAALLFEVSLFLSVFSSLSYVYCDVIAIRSCVLCSQQSILGQSSLSLKVQGFAQTQCLSPSWTGSAYCTTRRPSCSFTSLEKHIDEASPALLTMDVLGLFVLVFLAHSCLVFLRVYWSPGVTTKQSISVCSRIT